MALTPSTSVEIKEGRVEVREAPLVSSVAPVRMAAGPPRQPILTSLLALAGAHFISLAIFSMLNTCSENVGIRAR